MRVDSDATGGLSGSYARWRRSRLGRITDALEEALLLELAGPLAGRRALDVGGGDGQLALRFAKAGAEVTLIDSDAAMIAAAAGRFAAAGLPIRVALGRAEDLPFDDGSFDIATAVTTLCFVEEPLRAVGEMARVLRPGGRLVLGELNRYSAWAVWRGFRGWLGHSTWRRAHFSSARDLRTLMAEAGLRVETARGAAFYPPIGFAARLFKRLDPWLGRRFAAGAAFLAVAATKP